MSVKIALPKGRLLTETAALLEAAGWGLSEYHQQARLYRLSSARFPDLLAKMFQDKDIPIQVAVGNYDLGICSSDWVDELLVKYPSSAVIKAKDLGYGKGSLYIACSSSQKTGGIAEMQAKSGNLRIATEYPNLAEAYALKLRLRRFRIFPVWGGAEVYPPETADLALIAVRGDEELPNNGLVPVNKVFDSSAYLIANRDSWKTKNLSELLHTIYDALLWVRRDVPAPATFKAATQKHAYPLSSDEDTIWLALPDGHQQPPTLDLLKKAGIKFDEADFKGNRRPSIGLPGITVKVIRPQDMPAQVANGNFDLAITGRDWLLNHRYQFPSSPVKELLAFEFGRVKIVAVVSNRLAADDAKGLRHLSAELSPLRVASEYVNIADRYARDNRFGMYRIIPTWGASEAFLPEDADILIENTETGRTIARHNLKIVDTLFESTACLIGNTASLSSRNKSQRMRGITGILQKAAEGS